MSYHYPLAPSSAARTINCAGSVSLAPLYPEDDSQEAREGTAAHWAASEMLHGVIVQPGAIAPNGIMLDDEMMEAAAMYAGHIIGRGEIGYIESAVANDTLHALNGGTPDHYVFETAPPGRPYKCTLYMDDFKYGHDYVDVFENWQLINYTALVLAAHGVDGYTDQSMRVVMTIIQPRNYHRKGPIRTWECMASDLRGYFNRLRAAFEKAMQPNALCVANPECKNCTARLGCEAFIAAASSALVTARESVPLKMTPHDKGLLLRNARAAQYMLDACVNALEEDALSSLVRGENVPFFQIGHGEARTRWSKPIDEVRMLGDMFGVKLDKEALITPKQAVKAGIPDVMVRMYSETPRGAATLEPVDDKTASRIFK